MEGNTNQMKKEIYANSYSSEANVPRTWAVSLSQISPQYDNPTAEKEKFYYLSAKTIISTFWKERDACQIV
jgi:hypothetical protein